ncbi:MAG TPA: hypothetical protein DCQ32_04285 [Cyanobacteria bacterium UBA8156]|nr:hypothetical protein [Cyanobacteria bacterium UBA8156]
MPNCGRLTPGVKPCHKNKPIGNRSQGTGHREEATRKQATGRSPQGTGQPVICLTGVPSSRYSV